MLTVSQWADRHRRLSPEASAEPGNWHSDHAPYQRQMMDVLSSFSEYERVVVETSAQIGKVLGLDTLLPTSDGWTTMGEVCIGDVLFDEPGAQCRDEPAHMF
jgi:Phage terminase large subunit (GpA)